MPSQWSGPFPHPVPRALEEVARERQGGMAVIFSDIPGALQVTGTAQGFVEEGEPGGEGDLGLLPGPSWSQHLIEIKFTGRIGPQLEVRSLK